MSARVLGSRSAYTRRAVSSKAESSPPLAYPDNVVEVANGQRGGFNEALGLEFVAITPDRVEATVQVGPQHKQPYGLVHGGVYSAMAETVCSVGAALNVFAQGRSAVGLENHTSFLKAVRAGVLRAVATPVFRGKRSHVWEAAIRDEDDRVVASGRVRMMILEPGAAAGGAKVGIER